MSIGDLPIPRLEFEWEQSKDDPHQWVCMYWLVLPAIGTGDIRDPESLGYVRAQLGKTNRRSVNQPIVSGTVDCPFRDYSHMMSDAKALKLPGYARWGDHVSRVVFDYHLK